MRYKFEIRVRNLNNLQGLKLDREYDRLNFIEKSRRIEFINLELCVDFSKEEIIEGGLSFYFEDHFRTYITLSLEDMVREDFMEYGEIGTLLNKDAMSIERIKQLIQAGIVEH